MTHTSIEIQLTHFVEELSPIFSLEFCDHTGGHLGDLPGVSPLPDSPLSPAADSTTAQIPKGSLMGASPGFSGHTSGRL